MQGLELIKDLADRERTLAEKLEEAKRTADQRIREAEEQGKALMADVERQIRGLEEQAKDQISEQAAKFDEEARASAEVEVRRIRRQAAANIDRVVEFVVSKVLP